MASNVTDIMSKLSFLVAIAIFIGSISSGLVVGQEMTPTYTVTPSETPTLTPAPTITLTLFRDADSLTLHVPFVHGRVSLSGLEYRVALSDGQSIEHRLDRDFSSFLGLPFDEINLLGATCFRLVQVGAGGPIPIQCGNGPLLLTQQLAAADVFWFDGAATLERIVTIWQDDTFVGLCQAGQSACPIEMALLSALPTATPSMTLTASPASATLIPTPTVPASAPILIPTPTSLVGAAALAAGYPCEGTIVNRIPESTMLNVVRSYRSSQAPFRDPIQSGTPIIIMSKEPDIRSSVNNDWYQIANIEGTILGWVQRENIVLSGDCPA